MKITLIGELSPANFSRLGPPKLPRTRKSLFHWVNYNTSRLTNKKVVVYYRFMKIELFGIKLLEIRTPERVVKSTQTENQDLLILRGKHPYQKKESDLPSFVNRRTVFEPKAKLNNDHGMGQRRIWEENREESARRAGTGL